MSGEIQAAHTTGNTLYAVVLDASGRALAGTTPEAPLAANWAAYAIPMAEQSTTGLYEGDMSAVPAGTYGITAYRRAGGSPATTDPVVGSGEIRWTGTTVQPVQTGDAFARIGANGAGLTALATATGQTSILTDLATKASQASVDAIDDYVDAEVAAIKLVTDHLATALELDGSAYRFTAAALEQGSGVLAADGLDAIMVEAGLNARQALAVAAAGDGGVVSGAGTGTIVVKAAGDPSVTRITASTDAVGNRLSVTLNLPA